MSVTEINETLAGATEYALPAFASGTDSGAAQLAASPTEGRCRVVIENVTPQLDGGRHPIKRTLGESVVVEADLFADGHVTLSAVVKYRPEDGSEWSESPMTRRVNDRWSGEFTVTRLGGFLYTIEAWVDPFKTWREELRKKIAAGQNVEIELLGGAKLIEAAALRADAMEAERLKQWAKEMAAETIPTSKSLLGLAVDESLGEMMNAHAERAFASRPSRSWRVTVDPERARFSAWYEMFPRSFSPAAGGHGTFEDCEAQLPRIAGMGFDVLYLPPIHPIGRSFRKGKNNHPVCQLEAPGSPWAIGASEGGHKAVHPQLGTLEDLRRLVIRARSLGIEIALDVAFQCSPDHPYLREHPEWFRKRPDGSIAYAENPPQEVSGHIPVRL